jgi:hypothetical protein
MDAQIILRPAPVPGVTEGRGDSSATVWPAVVAWGAALIHLALGAGAITAPDGMQPVGVPLVALGTTALVWGAVGLARGRLIAPRAGVAGVVAGIVLGGVALWSDPVRTSIAAVAIEWLLLLTVGFACGRALRRARDGHRAPDAAGRGLVGLFIAAVLVAGVVTPALGATEAGRLAPDHSSHDIVFGGGHNH